MSVNAARVAGTCARLGRHTRTLYLTCSLVACVARGPPRGEGPLSRHNNAPKYAYNPVTVSLRSPPTTCLSGSFSRKEAGFDCCPKHVWPFCLHSRACLLSAAVTLRVRLCECWSKLTACSEWPGLWHEQWSYRLPDVLGVWPCCIEPRCPLAWGPSTSSAPTPA